MDDTVYERSVNVLLGLNVVHIEGGDQIKDESIVNLFKREIKWHITDETYNQLSLSSVSLTTSEGDQLDKWLHRYQLSLDKSPVEYLEEISIIFREMADRISERKEGLE